MYEGSRVGGRESLGGGNQLYTGRSNINTGRSTTYSHQRRHGVCVVSSSGFLPGEGYEIGGAKLAPCESGAHQGVH